MNISKFFGTTNREAMRQVRLALGSEALIISNKRINGGVEIIAADPTELDKGGTTLTVTENTTTPAANDLTGLIGDLKGSLEARMDEILWSDKLVKSHFAISLFQNLLRYGFSTALLRAMIKVMPPQNSERTALNWARAELIKNLPVLTAEDEFWQAGSAIALVGPTGVGKTTTVAKLAARFVQQYGADKLVLITTDTYRIGAYEQLKIYGELLKVPVYVSKNAQELQALIQEISADKTILIDNMGISQRDSNIANQANLLANAGRNVKRLLVLNAASHGDTLDEVAKTYTHDGGSKLSGCIISKIDESTKLAAVLDVAIRYRLKIHYVSNGQKVPENLLLADAKDLVDMALYAKLGQTNLYAPSDADLSALLTVATPEQTGIIKEQQRRQSVLLPRLLDGHINGQQITLDDLQSAIKVVDSDRLLADAYDLWQARQNNNLPRPDDLISHKHNVINSQDTSLKIVVHNWQNLAQINGKWLSTVCFTADGHAATALAQQTGLADGWYTLNGVMTSKPSMQDALFNQIQNENFLLADAKLHVFDGSSRALLAKLSNQQVPFLALSGARANVHIDGESFVLAAVANGLDWQAVNRQDLAFISKAGNLDISKYAWRAALNPVQIQVKGQFYNLTLFCLQAVNTTTDKPVKYWYSFTNQDLPVSVLTRAVLLRNEYQSVMRNVSSYFSHAENNILTSSFYQAQCGLAAWHLAQSDLVQKAGQIAAGMLGKSSLDSTNAYMALNKLYTLKELLD